MKQIFLIILIALIAHNEAYTQHPKENFNEITKQMDAYFKKNGKVAGYNQFKRMEYYYQTRVALDGSFVNTTQLKQSALQQTNNMNGNGIGLMAYAGSWNLVGPTAVADDVNGIGRANRITFHPSNANTFFISSAGGGLWRTTNGGSSYTCLTNGLSNINTSGMAIDYTNTNILYLLTGDGDASGPGGIHALSKYSTGVLKSYDGGQTWYQTGFSFPETYGLLAYNLVMHPTNPNILMVASNDGIYRTTNGGSTWSKLNSGTFYEIRFKPGSPSIVFTASKAFLYKSTNNGESFESVGTELGSSNFGRTAIAVCPSNANRVYILCGEAIGDDKFRGVFRYNDADETIVRTANTPNILGRDGSGIDPDDQSYYDLAVVARPDNSTQVLTGGIRLWRSANSGASFSFISNVGNYHDDVHDLSYNPLNNLLYMCGDGGVYRSGDHGITWTPLNTSLAITQYYKIATINSSPTVVVGGTQDNGTNKRLLSTSNFEQILGADGGHCEYGNSSSKLYASTQNGKFYRSVNGGSSFTNIVSEAYVQAILGTNITAPFITPLAVHSSNDDIIFLGYSRLVKAVRNSIGVYDLTNLGVGATSFVKVGQSNANRIYTGSIANGNSVQRSDDGGATFTFIRSQNPGSWPPVTDLAINPGNSLEIWLTHGGFEADKKVYYSSDGGATFANVTGSLPNVPVNCVVYGDNATNMADPVYIGTDIGVFYRDNNLGDWIPYSNGLPVVEVTDLEVNISSNILWAGTYGRGIWKSTLHSGCTTNYTLNNGNQVIGSPYFFQASNSIVSTAWVYGSGANVFYKAGVEVELKDGFHAFPFDNQHTFEAAIGPCTGGVPTSLSVPYLISDGKNGYLIEGVMPLKK